MARRRKRQNSEASGGGTWMTTFSDLMSLLLTFFILLFSMSSVSGEKFQAASQSMQVAFSGANGSSILDGGALVGGDGTGSADSDDSIVPADEGVPDEVNEMYEQTMDFIEDQELDSELAVSRNEKGVYLEIQESILFQSGEAEVTSSGTGTLDVVADLLASTNTSVVVEGHTDNVPINTQQYPSNWELSTNRAVSVVRYLTEEKGIDPARLSAKGHGEHNPIVSNNSSENRAKNRRVNIVLVYEEEKGTAE
ncbi:OmpA family protein [Atopococcus tabaci]|uniref:OmpA family protein n=1 Tax=Atopococcus tabaci TaxID=269774 RepID=UPI00042316B0|nr:OmpA family protein [Atopococcus tabaci]